MIFAMSCFSLALVLRFKTRKNINDMAKVSIKYEKNTPFGGIFYIREQFCRFVPPVIDKVLSLRYTPYGYLYSEIVESLSSVYFFSDFFVHNLSFFRTFGDNLWKSIPKR